MNRSIAIQLFICLLIIQFVLGCAPRQLTIQQRDAIKTIAVTVEPPIDLPTITDVQDNYKDIPIPAPQEVRESQHPRAILKVMLDDNNIVVEDILKSTVTEYLQTNTPYSIVKDSAQADIILNLTVSMHGMVADFPFINYSPVYLLILNIVDKHGNKLLGDILLHDFSNKRLVELNGEVVLKDAENAAKGFKISAQILSEEILQILNFPMPQAVSQASVE